ncbi:hypothetical protein ACHAXH_001930 [Discostella pseudostelligera]
MAHGRFGGTSVLSLPLHPPTITSLLPLLEIKTVLTLVSISTLMVSPFQFVGNLRVQPVNVETTHGTGNSDYVGTIMIRLTTDQGETLVYHILDAVYAPDSPFNILGIPFLGEYFGAHNPVPSKDDDGTYIRSSASKSHFVWDHGKHERHFLHDDRSLPVLVLENGIRYFQAFCTRSLCLFLCSFGSS